MSPVLLPVFEVLLELIQPESELDFQADGNMEKQDGKSASPLSDQDSEDLEVPQIVQVRLSFKIVNLL